MLFTVMVCLPCWEVVNQNLLLSEHSFMLLKILLIFPPPWELCPGDIFCTHTYTRVHTHTRILKELYSVGWMQLYWVLCFLCLFPESEGHCPSHIAVLCRGRAFVFDVLHEGTLITPPELLRFLNYILNELCILHFNYLILFFGNFIHT